MKYPILPVVILFLLFIIIKIKYNTVIEGYEDIVTNVEYSSKLREKVQQFKTELNSSLELDNTTVEHILKTNVLKAHLLSEIKNQYNPEIVTNSGNYNTEISSMLNLLMNEVDEERIESYDGDKEELRASINSKIEEDIIIYGNRVEVITKRFLDRKYRELEGQYTTLLSTNQCEGAEQKARKEEHATCTAKIRKKDDEIDTKNEQIKGFAKKIAQAERIKKRMKVLEATINRSSSSPKGGYCGGRKPGRHLRHCGGRTVNKNMCGRTYKKFRGKNLQCQWNQSRRSCDFWQPGRPHTKKYC